MDRLEAGCCHTHCKSMLTTLFQTQSDLYIFGIDTKSIYSFSNALFYLMSSTKVVCKSLLFWILLLKKYIENIMHTMLGIIKEYSEHLIKERFIRRLPMLTVAYMLMELSGPNVCLVLGLQSWDIMQAMRYIALKFNPFCLISKQFVSNLPQVSNISRSLYLFMSFK